MKHSLDYVDELVAKLEALKPISHENQQRLDKKFRLEFNFNSNHMEGNTLTYGETELLLIFDDTRGNHQMREYEEMKAHDAAYQLVREWASEKERPLTEQNIKNLNEIILVRPFWKDAITSEGQSTRRKILVGDYKQQPNSVRLQNGELFEYASPAETPIMMQELIDWYREEEDNLHPVTLAAMLHYKFVRIHPFDDGNGRMARLLMNYVLLRNGLPPVVIKSREKADYLRALHLADIGDHESFVDYISEQVAWSLNIFIKAAKGESIEEAEDWEKELVLLKQELKLDNNKEVQKFSRETIEEVFKHAVMPVLEQWELKLQEFDLLFNSRNCLIEIYTKTPSVYASHQNSLIAVLPNLWKQAMEGQNGLLSGLELICNYRGAAFADSNMQFHAGRLKFFFYDHAYEIEISEDIKNRRFPYGYFPNENESIEIANFFARNLMSSIREVKQQS